MSGPRSVRFYRGLLILLPLAVRREYGREMMGDVAALLAEASGRGRRAVLATLLAVSWDVVRRAPAEWLVALPAAPRPDLLELRVAGRALRRRPVFAATAVLTLGLGMGATLAIWGVVQSVLLRPLPYPEAERLVVVTHQAPGLDLPELENSVGTLSIYRDRARSFEAVAGTDLEERNLTGIPTPARVFVYRVSDEFFDAVRREPALGRRFAVEDFGPGPERVGILTHRAWQERFGGAADILGRTVSLNDRPVEIVGVMPPDFVTPTGRTREGRADPDLLLPFHLDRALGMRTFGIEGVMRLAEGWTPEDAQREVTALQSALVELDAGYTQEWLERARWSARVEPLLDRTVRDVRRSLWLLFGTVGLLLLIATANVANLLLVRGEGRRVEVTIRSALGAGRRRILGVFLSESLLISLAGALLGIAVAAATVRLLVAYGPTTVPRLADVRMDATVLVGAAILAVACGLGLGLAPALRGIRGLDTSALHTHRTTAGREPHRVRRALLVVQVALALVMLVGSGLLLRSFVRLRAVEPGVRTADVVAIGVSRIERDDGDGAVLFYQGVVDRVGALPGVLSVGATSSLPFLVDGINGATFRIRSRPAGEGDLPPVTMYATVLPGYFDAVGMRIVAGRAPERADHEQRRAVGWVNETFARRFLDGAAAGEAIRIGNDSTWLEIAGVVNDVRTFGLDEDIRPLVYLPPTTTVSGTTKDLMHIVVHHEGRGAAVIAATRDIVRRLDPTAPVTTVRTLDAVVARSMEGLSFLLVLLSAAASVALLLGVIGLYGAISYVVAQRTREIGVRIALGADAGAVRALVLRQGLAVVAIGVVTGLLVAAGATRLMGAVLFEVGTMDPLIFVATPLVLLGIGALATWLPARRASGVSPLEALRGE